MNKTPIFIGGLMKSGTTLLRTMLSNHSNIYTGLETHWFNNVQIKKNDVEYISQVTEYYDLNKNEVLDIIETSNRNNTPFVKELFSILTLRNNKKRWIEKTPQNLMHLDKIKKNFKEFKFIHVKRDFRDTFSSWKESNKSSVESFVKQVKENYDKFYRENSSIENDLIEVKYEDVILSTSETVTKVLNNLGEQIEEKCFQNNTKYSKAEFDKVLKVHGKKSQTLLSLQSKINSNKIGVYKKVLNEYEINFIETNLRPYFNLLGYEK